MWTCTSYLSLGWIFCEFPFSKDLVQIGCLLTILLVHSSSQTYFHLETGHLCLCWKCKLLQTETCRNNLLSQLRIQQLSRQFTSLKGKLFTFQEHSYFSKPSTLLDPPSPSLMIHWLVWCGISHSWGWGTSGQRLRPWTWHKPHSPPPRPSATPELWIPMKIIFCSLTKF